MTTGLSQAAIDAALVVDHIRVAIDASVVGGHIQESHLSEEQATIRLQVMKRWINETVAKFTDPSLTQSLVSDEASLGYEIFNFRPTANSTFASIYWELYTSYNFYRRLLLDLLEDPTGNCLGVRGLYQLNGFLTQLSKVAGAREKSHRGDYWM